MYTYTHGGAVIEIRRFNEKSTGLKIMYGKVKYDGKLIYNKAYILESPGDDGIKSNKPSFEFAAEMLNDIALMRHTYSFEDRYRAVGLLRLHTIDYRRKFSPESYDAMHNYITKLSMEVQSTHKF